MPRLADHETLVQTLAAEGVRSVYHRGGAFAFDRQAVLYRGWVDKPDPTIRPAWQEMTRLVDPGRMVDATAELLAEAGESVYLMPTSHWAHELEAHPWLVELFESQSVGVSTLRGLSRAEPVVYELPREGAELRDAVGGLLTRLAESDFSIAVPGCPVLVTLHHHRQVWWRTPDVAWAGRIDAKVS
jgi:hypothetical protein